MNKQEALKLIKINTDNFPGRFLANATPDRINTMADTWHQAFKELPADIVMTAYISALKICQFPIMPADIFGELKKVQKAQLPDVDHLWQEILKAGVKCKRLSGGFDYNADSQRYPGLTLGQEKRRDCRSELSKLRPVCKNFVGNYHRLIEIGGMEDRELRYYFKDFKDSAERYEERQEVLGGGTNLMEAAKKLALDEGKFKEDNQ